MCCFCIYLLRPLNLFCCWLPCVPRLRRGQTAPFSCFDFISRENLTQSIPACLALTITIGAATCSDGTPGIENSSSGVCCPTECGGCGGSGCHRFGGGRRAGLGRDFCCSSDVLEAELICGVNGQAAPCIIPDEPVPQTPAPTVGATPEPETPMPTAATTPVPTMAPTGATTPVPQTPVPTVVVATPVPTMPGEQKKH